MNDSRAEKSSNDQMDQHPLNRDFNSPGMWTYFSCYFLIGLASVIILIEVIQSGLYWKLGVPCMMIWIGLMGLVAARRKEHQPE